jgi:carboxymethylenebutenolidase
MKTTETITELPVDEGEMTVVTYAPVGGAPRPAIILLHSATGLEPRMLEIAQDLSEKGFVVAAPDTFHRAGRMRMAPHGATVEESMALRDGMTNAGHLSDMNALVRHLQAQSYVLPGPVGITGFCLGGRISFLAASQGVGIGPSVLFYPTRLDESDPAVPGSPAPIGFSSGVTEPMLVFFPELDEHNPPASIAAVSASLANAPAEIHVVEGADHGYAQPQDERFHAVEGPRTWREAISFFAKHLQQAPVS